MAGASSDHTDRTYLALTLANLGMVSRKQGRLPEAEALLAEALALYDKLFQENFRSFAVQYGRARTRSSQGGLLADAGRLAEAEQAFREALAQQKSLAAFSDAGGMMRLNLDEMTPQTDPKRLIERGR